MPITQQASAFIAEFALRTRNTARSNGWRPPFPQTHRYPQHFHIPQLHPPAPLPSQSGSFQAVGTRQKRTRRDSSDSGGDDSADTSIATGFKRLKLDQLPGGCAPATLPYNTYNIEYHMQQAQQQHQQQQQHLAQQHLAQHSAQHTDPVAAAAAGRVAGLHAQQQQQQQQQQQLQQYAGDGITRRLARRTLSGGWEESKDHSPPRHSSPPRQTRRSRSPMRRSPTRTVSVLDCQSAVVQSQLDACNHAHGTDHRWYFFAVHS
eukprot:18458-Heterococcus_DN1.PRE.1